MFLVRFVPPVAAGLLALALAGAAHATDASGDPIRGKALYQACSGCHSLDENDVGPKHRGVVGRHSAIVPGYNYSPALKASGLTWSKANLDRWLTNPQALVPGARMFFSVKDAQSRADIIAYLSEQR
jgi:cytochrome c